MAALGGPAATAAQLGIAPTPPTVQESLREQAEREAKRLRTEGPMVLGTFAQVGGWVWICVGGGGLGGVD